MIYLVYLWIIFAMIASGFVYANCQRRFAILAVESEKLDSWFSIFIGLLGGPITLILAFGVFGCYNTGWKLPFTKFTAKEWDEWCIQQDKYWHPKTRPEE